MRHWFHEHSVRPPDARAHSGRPNDHARRPVPADHCLRSRLAQVRTGPRPTLLFPKIWRECCGSGELVVFLQNALPPPPPPPPPRRMLPPAPPARRALARGSPMLPPSLLSPLVAA